MLPAAFQFGVASMWEKNIMSKKHRAHRSRRILNACLEPLESRTLFNIVPNVPGFIDLTDTVVLKSNKPVKPGSDAKLAVTVKNLGNESATGGLTIELEDSLTSGGSDPGFIVDEAVALNNLGAGKSKTFNFSVPVETGTPPDDYFIVAVVDPGNTFQESNTSNNTAVTPTALDIIDPYPDMTGIFEGTYKVNTGPNKGVKGTVEFVVNSESDTTGDISGTTLTDPGEGTTFTGSILADGDVSMNTTDDDDSGTGLVTGKFSKGKFTGTFMANDGDVSKFTATIAPP
jgi:hypothetical protein